MAKKTIVYAFVLEAKRQLFGELASEQDINKIRSDTNAQGAEVRVIPPKEWKPPKISSTSDKALGSKMVDILFRAQDWFFINAYHEGMSDTLAGGIIIRPKDGKKVFLAVKVDRDI